MDLQAPSIEQVANVLSVTLPRCSLLVALQGQQVDLLLLLAVVQGGVPAALFQVVGRVTLSSKSPLPGLSWPAASWKQQRAKPSQTLAL